VITAVSGSFLALIVIGTVAGSGHKDKTTNISTTSASSKEAPSPSPSAEPEVTTSQEVAASQPPATQVPAPQAPTSWPMPDLRGMNLQDAQDRIQAVAQDPFFITTSHDLRENRHQIIDENWQVCTQSVRPGARFTANNPPDFGVVRIDVETCP
jgi:hypothetical protein